MVPVVWLNYHPEICTSPGMWDQEWIQETFLGTLFTPPRPFTFEDHYGTWPDAPGIVLIVPGRFHQYEAQRISRDLEKYQWVLMIVTSDEERLFPWWDVEHPRMLTWVQTPMHEKDREASVQFGIGSPPGTVDWLRGFEGSSQKNWSVFFSGQVTHPRREQMMKYGQRFGAKHSGHVQMRGTEGFTQGYEKGEYLRYMLRAKVVPAPMGAVTVDTFRFWEALEAGAVPIPESSEYWRRINQLPNEAMPLLQIKEWNRFAAVTMDILSNWQEMANLCGSWLLRTKRELALRLHADLVTLGATPPEPTPDDAITVLIPTSYINSHPSTNMLWQTVASVRKYLPNAEILIMMDGGMHPDYQEYQRRVLEAVKYGFGVKNVSVKIFTTHMHQTGMTSWALANFVKTEYILFVEHDTPLTIAEGQGVPFGNLLTAMSVGHLDYLRLHFQTRIHPEHEHLMHSMEPVDFAGVPVIMTTQWSQRPHLAPKVSYQLNLERYAADRTQFIEEIMHSAAADKPANFRMGIYAPPGNMERSYHLDGRNS